MRWRGGRSEEKQEDPVEGAEGGRPHEGEEGRAGVSFNPTLATAIATDTTHPPINTEPGWWGERQRHG